MGFMAAQVAPTWRVSDRLRGCLLVVSSSRPRLPLTITRWGCSNNIVSWRLTSNSREPDVGDVDERSQDAVLEELVIAAVSAEVFD